MKVYKFPSVRTGPMTESYTYYSPTPKTLLMTQEPCVLGVDEAGRGPVLGPMCFGVTYCAISKYEKLIDLEYKDSKKLNEKTRESLLQRMITNQDDIGWGVHCLSPQDISALTVRDNINLNKQSHSSTIKLIREIINTKVNVEKIYVDTVGSPEKYQNLLQAQFPQQTIVVEKAADDKFPIVSAASICAKITRDHILRDWSFIETDLNDPDLYDYGSGYPNEKTKRWLKRNVYPHHLGFYPSIVRWHWKPARQILYDKGLISFDQIDNCTWPGLEDTNDTTNHSTSNKMKRSNKDIENIWWTSARKPFNYALEMPLVVSHHMRNQNVNKENLIRSIYFNRSSFFT